MELASDIGWRNDDRIGCFIFIYCRVEVVTFKPKVIGTVLKLFRIVNFIEFFSHLSVLRAFAIRLIVAHLTLFFNYYFKNTVKNKYTPVKKSVML